MRGVDEETLIAVRKSLAAEGLNTDVIDAHEYEWTPYKPEIWRELNK